MNQCKIGECGELVVEIPATVYLRLVRAFVCSESEYQSALLEEFGGIGSLNEKELREFLKNEILRCIFYEDCIKTNSDSINEKIMRLIDSVVDARVFEIKNEENNKNE